MNPFDDFELTDEALDAFNAHMHGAPEAFAHTHTPHHPHQHDVILPGGDQPFHAYLADQDMVPMNDMGEHSDCNDSFSGSSDDGPLQALSDNSQHSTLSTLPLPSPLGMGSVHIPATYHLPAPSSQPTSPAPSFAGSPSSPALTSASPPTACDTTSVSSGSGGSAALPPVTRVLRERSVSAKGKRSYRKAPTRREKNHDKNHEPLDKRERNKVSAHKYRERRKQYIGELEEKVSELETEVDSQKQTISTLQTQNKLLQQQLTFFQSLIANGSDAVKTAAAKFKASTSTVQRGGIMMMALLSCFLLCAPLGGPLSSSTSTQVQSPAFDPSVSNFRSRALLSFNDAASAQECECVCSASANKLAASAHSATATTASGGAGATDAPTCADETDCHTHEVDAMGQINLTHEQQQLHEESYIHVAARAPMPVSVSA